MRFSATLIVLVFMSFTLKAGAISYKELFSLLDLERPGLETVRDDCERKKWKQAAEHLLDYYRSRQNVYVPGQDSRQASPDDFVSADDALQHTFHVLAEPVWNYGRNINWQYWPVKEIEMRVQLHRHSWWTSLARVYTTTGDSKYIREYKYEFRDWVRKNLYKPFDVNQYGTVSSGAIDVNASNECFAWRPLEVGIRLLRWCTQFSLFVDSPDFTPEFLMEFLLSYHQHATVMMQTFSPAGNHLIHQSQGILRAGICFPEFKEAVAWAQAGVDNLNREITRQSYEDGCHFELDPGYHIGFIESYDSAIQLARKNNRADLFPQSCLEQLLRMTSYYLSYCYPNGTHPCFSDARTRDDQAGRELLEDVGAYADSHEARQVKWFATAGKSGEEPPYKSCGHPHTGFYTFRDGWFDAKVIMPVKATQRGMWHAQPDFGTFELWAYGKRLMPDSGAYTYSGDEEIERQRAYFKATARHNALTLDNRDYDDPVPQLVEWRPEGDVQILSVQHEAYAGLTRRRHIAFVEERFFIVVDEVCGPASGNLTLRNCLGPGSLTAMPAKGSYLYRDGNAVLCIFAYGPEESVASVAKDWFSEAFHEKTERSVIRLDVPRKVDDGVQSFVTILYPFDAAEEAMPAVAVNSVTNVGDNVLKVDVGIADRNYNIEFNKL